MKRVLTIVIVALLLLPVLLAGGCRIGRRWFDPPITIKPGFADVKNAGVHIFGARVGPKVILFDAGMDPDGAPVDALLAALNAARPDVSDIFLTHGHPDHIAAVNQFSSAHVRAGAEDAAWVAGRGDTDKAAPRLVTLFMALPPSRITDPLKGIVTIPVGLGKNVNGFPAPGHTPGSYVFLFDDVLIMGDVMNWDGEKLGGPPGLFDAYSDANNQAARALRPMLQGRTFDRVCTGHGGCTPAGQGRAMFDDRLARIK